MHVAYWRLLWFQCSGGKYGSDSPRNKVSADEEAETLRRMLEFYVHNIPVHKGVELLTSWATINVPRQALYNGLHKDIRENSCKIDVLPDTDHGMSA
jgi:hypothetical protein